MKMADAQIEPGLRLFAIGDIHGCVDQLNKLLSLIEQDLSENPVQRSKVVFLGDYVDRGPENKHVIDTLISLDRGEMDCVFLLGNHDERMIKFIEDPELVWDAMMRWGGVQTLASYGVVAEPGESEESISVRFATQVPAEHFQFLRSFKHFYVQDDFYFCHAGVRPGISLANQSDHDLIWIRDAFRLHKEQFEKVIVHGHTPQKNPEVESNRINVDTKCYETGVLTALVLEGNSHRFLQTGAV